MRGESPKGVWSMDHDAPGFDSSALMAQRQQLLEAAETIITLRSRLVLLEAVAEAARIAYPAILQLDGEGAAEKFVCLETAFKALDSTLDSAGKKEAR